MWPASTKLTWFPHFMLLFLLIQTPVSNTLCRLCVFVGHFAKYSGAVLLLHMGFFTIIISSLLWMVRYLKTRAVYRKSAVTPLGRGHIYQYPKSYQKNTPSSNIFRWFMWTQKTGKIEQFDLETPSLNFLFEGRTWGNDGVCNSEYGNGLQIVILEHYQTFSFVYVCSDDNFPLLGLGIELSVSNKLLTITCMACPWYFEYKASKAKVIKNGVLMVNVILMQLWLVNFCPRFGKYLHLQPLI